MLVWLGILLRCVAMTRSGFYEMTLIRYNTGSLREKEYYSWYICQWAVDALVQFRDRLFFAFRPVIAGHTVCKSILRNGLQVVAPDHVFGPKVIRDAVSDVWAPASS